MMCSKKLIREFQARANAVGKPITIKTRKKSTEIVCRGAKVIFSANGPTTSSLRVLYRTLGF